jgi:hypothetical protein
MLPGMQIKHVPLGEINAADERFRISEELDPPAIFHSLREVGQLNPVILITQNHGYGVVCGFRRVRAMQRLGKPAILAQVLPEDGSDPVRILLTALWDNLAHRQLHPLEAARLLYSLKYSFAVPDQTLIKIYLPILGLNPSESVLRSHLRLHTINPSLRQCLADGRLSLASIDTLAAMAAPAQESFAALMQKIRLSASLQKKLFGLLEDLATNMGCEPETLLSGAEASAITGDTGLSPFQRGEKIHEYFFRLRNPRLWQAADRFQAKLKKLNLPGTIHVRTHPFFEEQGIHVEFDAPDAERFRELADALQAAARSPDASEIFILE